MSEVYPTWFKIWEFDKVGATYLKKRSAAEATQLEQVG